MSILSNLIAIILSTSFQATTIDEINSLDRLVHELSLDQCRPLESIEPNEIFSAEYVGVNLSPIGRENCSTQIISPQTVYKTAKPK